MESFKEKSKEITETVYSYKIECFFSFLVLMSRQLINLNTLSEKKMGKQAISRDTNNFVNSLAKETAKVLL